MPWAGIGSPATVTGNSYMSDTECLIAGSRVVRFFSERRRDARFTVYRLLPVNHELLAKQYANRRLTLKWTPMIS